jgi:hypothetical protein
LEPLSPFMLAPLAPLTLPDPTPPAAETPEVGVEPELPELPAPLVELALAAPLEDPACADEPGPFA